MTKRTSTKHECPKDRYRRTYLSLFVDEFNDIVIMHRKGNKLQFPRLVSSEVPAYGERMSECFSERLEEVSGTKYKLVFLYSSINEPFQVDIGTPYCAIFQCISPIDPKTKDPVHPTSHEYVWMQVDEVEDIILKDNEGPCDYSALYALLRPDYQPMEDGALRPWEVPNWYVQVTKRATNALSAEGYLVTSDFEQHVVTCNAAILRVQTQRGRVYLKVSIGREGRLTELIASFAPHVARKPILFNEKEEWMFMDDYGKPLDDIVESLPLDAYETLSIALAELHIESMKHVEELKACGAKQETCESWIERIREMLNDEDVLRSLGEFEDFDSVDGLADVKVYYAAVCEFFNYLFEPGRYPICLVHGDVHLGNIMKCYDDKLILFDWGCTYLGFPMSDIRYLRAQIFPVSLRKKVGMGSYLKAWEGYASISDLKTLCVLEEIKNSLKAFLELFEYARKRNIYPRLEPDNADGLRGTLIDVENQMRLIRTQNLHRHENHNVAQHPSSWSSNDLAT